MHFIMALKEIVGFIFFLFRRDKINVVETMYPHPGLRCFLYALAVRDKSEVVVVSSLSSKYEFKNSLLELKYVPLIVGLPLCLPYALMFTFKAFILKKDPESMHVAVFGFDIKKNFLDSLDISCGINWNRSVRLKVIMRVLIEMSYAAFFMVFVKIVSNRTSLFVSGDSVYRYGILVDLFSVSKVSCVTNVNLNALTFSYFYNGFKTVPGRVEMEMVDYIKNEMDFGVIDKDVDSYFKDRFSGNLMQHDVLNAYSARDSENNSKAIEVAKSTDKIIVTVFSHVFCDAPRSINGMLFVSFREWFVWTIKSLSKNRNVELFIREHPSSHLYNEKGMVEDIISEMNLTAEIYFWDEETTDAVLELSDWVVTCSGTVALEAAYLKIPTVVAATANYGGSGSLYEFLNKEDYLQFLESINHCNLPDEFNLRNVKIICYIIFLIFNNLKKYEGYPLPPYVRGQGYEKNISKEVFGKVEHFVHHSKDFSADLNMMFEESIPFFCPDLYSFYKHKGVIK